MSTARQWLISEATKELNSKTRTDDAQHDAHMAVENVCSNIRHGHYSDDNGYSQGIVKKAQQAREYYLACSDTGLERLLAEITKQLEEEARETVGEPSNMEMIPLQHAIWLERAEKEPVGGYEIGDYVIYDDDNKERALCRVLSRLEYGVGKFRYHLKLLHVQRGKPQWRFIHAPVENIEPSSIPWMFYVEKREKHQVTRYPMIAARSNPEHSRLAYIYHSHTSPTLKLKITNAKDWENMTLNTHAYYWALIADLASYLSDF